MNRKRVMFLCHGAGNGGAERVIVTLANAFVSDGYIVSLVTTNKEHNDYCIDPLIERQVALSNASNVITRTIDRIKQLRQYVRLFNPNCIISFSSIPNIQILIATIGLNVRVIISERTDPSRYPTNSIAKKLRLMLYPMADKIVFQTNEAKNYFPEKIRDKGVVIFNPIRDDLPSPYTGIRENRIIGIGSLGEQKNWIIALKAAEIFFKNFPNYTFDIFGEGPDREYLQEYIAQSPDLRERVYLRGFSHNVVKEMNAARMYISSSKYDGIPNSMLEALATGVPTIYTDCPVGGPREFITTGQNGFLVPVGDVDALADRMMQLASNDILCKKLSHNSIYIRERLKLSKIFLEWKNLVEYDDE